MAEARVHLDHNATSPLRPEARAALIAALDEGGNPSSVHADGRAARGRMEVARTRVAALCGAPARGVMFTSGATEANALALHPSWEIAGRPMTCDVLLTSAVEHPAVLRGHRFADAAVELLPVDEAGRLELDALSDRLAAHAAAGRRALVSLMAANNETGVIQPVAEAAELAKVHGGLMHCDAVQAAGRLPLDMTALGLDLLSLSAHKLGGPQGAGALVAASEDTRPLVPLLRGGGQERGRRGGTENVPAVAGFGAAAEAARLAQPQEAMRLAHLRDLLEQEIVAALPETEVVGGAAARVPNTSCIAFGGLKAETLVIALDLSHIAVSAGSACSSGKVGSSHVLSAMGFDAVRAGGAIRLSLGWSSTEQDVERAIAALRRVVPQVRSRSLRAA
ncbi:cysteine desulfurase [Azorhizobium sp. AG788]|uniref:cysteine desulfurase family protein n=1 Tax=Azorhizobium sp. AG788 TaxID=2183897 RepID=UPI00105FBF56|nr:cysteine desulfurase family protein [Azorhizobium sp. AG788]TDU01092.1 cysteine desulfurase [Azorhizobium sp. AG788]